MYFCKCKYCWDQSNKISKKVDNIETFQDFFNLFNKNEMKGNTPLDSINFTFKLKESIFFLNQLEAVQKNIKVLSNGKYSSMMII